jgi:hypothetical protein
VMTHAADFRDMGISFGNSSQNSAPDTVERQCRSEQAYPRATKSMLARREPGVNPALNVVNISPNDKMTCVWEDAFSQGRFEPTARGRVRDAPASETARRLRGN